MMHLSSLHSALKGKAPIVAIPVEGHAPACIDRKRLAAWCKGVTIAKIEIVQHPPVTHYDYKRPASHPYDEHGRFIGGIAEGPSERITHVTAGARTLLIEGTAGRVKTRCSPRLIDRRTAVKTLAAWSEKERARLQKKTMLGALDKSQRKAIKLTAHGDTAGAGAVTIQARYLDKVYSVTGVAVTLPGFEGTDFIIHPAVDEHGDIRADWWTVTERFTGSAAGSNTTAEAALLTARENICKASPAAMTSVLDKIRLARLATLATAA